MATYKSHDLATFMISCFLSVRINTEVKYENIKKKVCFDHPYPTRGYGIDYARNLYV